MFTRERLQEIKRFFKDRTYLAGGSRSMEGGIIWELLGEIERLEAACREKDKHRDHLVSEIIKEQNYCDNRALHQKVAELEATVERLTEQRNKAQREMELRSSREMRSHTFEESQLKKEVERLTQDLTAVNQNVVDLAQEKAELDAEHAHEFDKRTKLLKENKRLREALDIATRYLGRVDAMNQIKAALGGEKP